MSMEFKSDKKVGIFDNQDNGQDFVDGLKYKYLVINYFYPLYFAFLMS